MILRKALVVALGLGALNAVCQDTSQVKTIVTCTFSEVYAEEGWTIPGLDGAKRQQHQASKDNPGFFITQLQPVKAETFISPDVSCPYDHPGRLEIKNRPIRVMSLLSWDYEGKVFGYVVFYALQDIQQGVRTELAEASTLQFFDVDGSGRFTVMRPPSDIKRQLAPAIIPGWIQRLSGESPKN
jgi:hypothetical protein